MGKSFGPEFVKNFLLPLVKKKVLTETELIKLIGNICSVDDFFKTARIIGFPVRRRDLQTKFTRSNTKGTRRPLVKHRVVIYYME